MRREAVWLYAVLFATVAGSSTAASCADGDLRLRDGESMMEGRVEICYQQRWGTICDDGWDTNEAMVVCRQLGFATAGARAARGEVFPSGEGSIILDDMTCTGTETSLLNCSGRLEDHDCRHSEDAGVACEALGFSCEDGEVRLVGGQSKYEGRVEVCRGNTFTTVCDDSSWGGEDASIVCRQLGFTNGTPVAVAGGDFGVGLGRIGLLGLRCIGNETSLVDCPVVPTFGTLFCSHYDDAGVLCPRPDGECADGDVRLEDGRIPSEGRVEFCINGHWGSVCHDGWDSRDAYVVCRQLGYNGSIPETIALGYGDIGTGDGVILFSDLTCIGNESNLAECDHSGLAKHLCTHNQDAAVVCPDPSSTCTNEDVRLVGGKQPTEGRLEVCYLNHWATVCDDLFDNVAAAVACRHLGYTSVGSVALPHSYYGGGVGIILLDNVVCVGNETSIFDCSNLGLGVSNCLHTEDVSIICQPNSSSCINGEIRLVNGSSSNEGRVEVCFSGQWGTVCDDGWGPDDATIVCRQLNFTLEGAIGIHGAYFGQGQGPVFLDEVNCSPENHTTLLSCFSNEIGSHDCLHSEDASVICPVQGMNLTCNNGDIRLVGRDSNLEGRVELCIQGVWGTICGNDWTDLDASVVCQQVGYAVTDARSVQGGPFASSSGPIHFESFFCDGDEATILECPHRFPRVDTCSHAIDAGVICRQEPCVDGDVRLVDGQLPSEGRVELCLKQSFGTICDDYWDNADAAVVCRQLGFSDKGAIALPRAFFGIGKGKIALTGIDCLGNESSISACPQEAERVPCIHYEDAGLLCQSENSSLLCNNGDVRLTTGDPRLNNAVGIFSGHVEVCFNGRWGSICQDAWTNVDAQTVCGLLGFDREGALATVGSYFGLDVEGPIFLDEVRCNGTEDNLLACLSVDPGVHNCNHFRDAGVVCPVFNASVDECRSGDVRLADGPSSREGRVELCINDEWGYICGGRTWGNTDAAVVCGQLGFGFDGVRAVSGSRYGPGQGLPYMGLMFCNGDEETVMDCLAFGLGALCINDPAAVQCTPPVCYDGNVQLVGGEGPNEGRVEVCVDETWSGSICEFLDWDNNDAAVVCRQLGFPSKGAVAVRGNFFGAADPNGEVLYPIRCNGTETALSDCLTMPTPCPDRSRTSAGVICPTANANCTNGDVRLADGDTPYEGRVEVCVHGRWGTVCDDMWDGRDATVVCNQLNFTGNGYPFAIRYALFGLGAGLILLDELDCDGSEPEILACPADGLGVHNCESYEDAGVYCPYPTDGTSKCRNGELRLVDGTSRLNGRVELCIAGKWGTVCGDNFWTEKEAAVTCRQLGLEAEGAMAIRGGGFPPGNTESRIFLQQLSCNGSEEALVSCPPDEFGQFFTFGCSSHTMDAGVVCRDPNLRCNDGDVRLMGGASEFEGRVEVCYGNQFGTICDDQWDDTDAAVVCKQLGFNFSDAIAINSSFFGPGVGPIYLTNVQCSRDSVTIPDCIAEREHECSHFEDAGAICEVPDPECKPRDVRLVAGSTPQEGRVEVCFAGRWGSICDDNWDEKDARVVCRQLGFSDKDAVPRALAYFGHSSGPILVDDIHCRGDEARLYDCTTSAPGNHDCEHVEDAGVECQVIPCLEGAIRLVGGANSYSGRAEVCVGGTWGTLCGNNFTTDNAGDVCSKLMFGSQGGVNVFGGLFGPGSGTVYDFSTCTAGCKETSDKNCNHDNDVGVFCPEPVGVLKHCQSGDVRLVGGATTSEGRLEVCVNNAWGTVCDDSWDDNGARVACGQLGMPNKGAQAVYGGEFPAGTGPVLLDDIKCTGGEDHLLSCPQNALGQNDCSHSEDAGVKCLAQVGTETDQQGGGKASPVAAIVVPIIVVAIIAIAIIVIVIVGIITYRAYRVGKFSRHRDDNIAITSTLAFTNKPDAESSDL